MNRSLLFFMIVSMFFSCKALKDSSKYKLTDGLYQSRTNGRKTRVYVKNDGDSILVYKLEKGRKALQLQPDRLKPTVYAAGHIDKEIEASNYRKSAFDLDVLTMPFKYRPSTSSFSPQLSNHLNGALFVGYRRDTYELSYRQNPIGQVSQRITHLGLSGGFATGIGVTPMNPWVTQNNINVEYDGFIWSKALCIMAAVEKLNFGLAFGVDHLMESNKKYWIYQGKPYLGLTVGLNLN